MTAVKSPLRWHGGKSYLAKWIISHFPPHTRYVEPFFGGGSVMLAKDPEGVAEFANDIYGELADFWFVLANTPDRMIRALWGTPLSEDSFDVAAKNLMDCDRVRRATAFFIRNRQSRQGLGKDYCTPTSRLRRGMNENVSAWLSAVDGLPEVHERLRRVEVWNRDAIDVIRELDSPETLYFVDPPYLHDTRTSKDAYHHEMEADQHIRLLRTLSEIKGKFVLSGYPHITYDLSAETFGWHISDKETPLHSSSKPSKEKKVERLWMNFDPKEFQ